MEQKRREPKVHVFAHSQRHFIPNFLAYLRRFRRHRVQNFQGAQIHLAKGIREEPHVLLKSKRDCRRQAQAFARPLAFVVKLLRDFFPLFLSFHVFEIVSIFVQRVLSHAERFLLVW